MTSPLLSTIEPVATARDTVRILVEAHTITSKRLAVIESVESLSEQEEFTLTTAICSSTPSSKSLNDVAVLIVELHCALPSTYDSAVPEGSLPIDIRIDGITSRAFNSGGSRDLFGPWEWTIHLNSLVIPLAYGSCVGGARISGRKLPLLVEYQWKDLEEYWEGRGHMILNDKD